jgi:hypothetical protein
MLVGTAGIRFLICVAPYGAYHLLPRTQRLRAGLNKFALAALDDRSGMELAQVTDLRRSKARVSTVEGEFGQTIAGTDLDETTDRLSLLFSL